MTQVPLGGFGQFDVELFGRTCTVRYASAQ